MFPLWDVAIAPVIRAAQAQRIVEIGALRGETTVRLLDELGPEAEIHVIDPLPEFDPTEHEERFPGRYVFHRALSLDVLGDLPPVDVALVDGDHNWYTVFHELQALATTAARNSLPLPVLILHDVAWPYGRRDLYYEPSQIPPEHRQPHKRRGMRPGRRDLLERGGVNSTLHNAIHEGGEHNGVRTALDDFLAEHAGSVRRVLVPVYFGLEIVVAQERLDALPELAATLDRLESAQGRHDLLEIAEEVRLEAVLSQHNTIAQLREHKRRAAQRYLSVVKSALLNEHYLENEVRLEELARALTPRRRLDIARLRDPQRQFNRDLRRLVRVRSGEAAPSDDEADSFLPFTAMGRARLDHLEGLLNQIRRDGVRGDLVDCGTGRGGGAVFMRAYLEGHEVPTRRVWVADRFRASDEPDTAPSLGSSGVAGLRPDLNLVRDAFDRFDLLDDRVRFLQGPPDVTLADAPISEIALLRIGRGTGKDARAVLEHCYDRLAPGGFVVVDERRDSGCRESVEAFRRSQGLDQEPERIDGSAFVFRKPLDASGDTDTEVVAEPEAGAPRAPLAPPTPSEAVDLSVVVVFYNMRREAERTLHSLSRAYQEGLADATYEVIAIDNGSDDDQRLGEELVSSFGPEFRYLDLGSDAHSSPTVALNRGIRAARGRALALMIDGAHVLTPGVLRFGLAGLRTYAPAMVSTPQWYVGPGQQGEVIDLGYDEQYEDKLFDWIGWPDDGYRLFEIGHFIGQRDWFDPAWESNCLFVDRQQLEQVGGFDESFSTPGGGYSNLDLYERIGSSPDVAICSIIGEGSFHQVHGGTTTNQSDVVERRTRVFGYGEDYSSLRGKAYKVPPKPMYYVGHMPDPSMRRTKPRFRTAEAFAENALVEGDGLPEEPSPVPDDLVTAFNEAVWRSLPWTNTTWLGRRIETPPTDLLAYQEIIASVKPEWIVETGTGDGSRALFLASVCDLVGTGRVLSVDETLAPDLPQHPRIRYLRAAAQTSTAAKRITEIVGDAQPVVVILGGRLDRARTRAQFGWLAPLVGVGSYVIVAETIVNGNPVWPAFGPGPSEAVKQILSANGEFVSDPEMEKYSLTFNPGGYLKRIR